MFVIYLLSLIALVKLANVIDNPSFEEIDTNGFAKSWAKQGNCSVTTSTARTGKYSMHCTGGGSGIYLYKSLPIKGIKYILKGYIKVKNISGGSVLFCSESSNYIYGCYSYSDNIAACKGGTCVDQWYEIGCTSLMNFGNATFYVTLAQLRPGTSTGEFWMDDISLEPVFTPVLLAVEVVTWRQEVFKDEVEVLVDLDIIDSIFENGMYLTITVEIIDEQTKEVKMVLREYTFRNVEDNRVAVFKWDPSSLPKDKFYIVQARTVNSLFDNKTETAYTTVKKLASKRNYKFYVDKNLIAWDNGKKFFPLGLYVQYVNDTDLELFRNSPFNLIKLPGVNAAAINRVYNKTNGQVRVINNIVGVNTEIANPSDKDKEMIRANITKNINAWKDLPGFFGYYIADEPGVYRIKSLREVTLTIRELDPDHVTWPAINNRLELRKYKEMFDVVGIDCYPVQHYDDLHAIWVMARQSRSRMINNRAMWNIPQIFDWTVYDRKNESPPTEKQLRQMTYQWIVGGAMGIIYYDFTEMRVMDYKNPFDQEWEKVKRVATELKEKYVDIILSDEPVNDEYVIPKFDSIGGANYFGRRLWKYKGDDYLLIVNVRNVKYNITFKKPNDTDLVMIMGESNMTINTTTHIVKLEMPEADVVWLKGTQRLGTVAKVFIGIAVVGGVGAVGVFGWMIYTGKIDLYKYFAKFKTNRLLSRLG